MNSTDRSCKNWALIITVFLYNLAFAQDSSESDSIEEILVTGDRSLSAIKAQMEIAQDLAFDLYNELYADTDYEIICRREYIPYARRDDRNCDTRFVREREEEALEDYMFHMETGATDGDLPAYQEGAGAPNFLQVEQHIEEVDQNIAELYQANAEFRQKVNEYDVLNTAYQEALQADWDRGFWSRIFGSSD